jgi:hypothetical protein
MHTRAVSAGCDYAYSTDILPVSVTRDFESFFLRSCSLLTGLKIPALEQRPQSGG